MAPEASRPIPPSVYRDTAPPAPPTPPLTGDRRVRAAIIGGGFTGLSAALHLSELGVEALLLEAHEPGWGASGRNGGQVNPGLKYDPDEIEAHFGPDLGGRMIALSMGAPGLVFDLIARHGIAAEPSRTGTLRVAFHDGDSPAIHAAAEQGQRRGMPVRLLDAAEMLQATGTDRYVCGMLDPRGGHLNPLAYARGLAAAAMRAGASIHGGTHALSLRREGGLWHIATPRGTVRAESVILGTNGYTDNLWPGLRRSVVPVFSSITATEPLPGAVAAQVMPCRSALYEIGKVTVYYRLDAQNRFLMGGRSLQRDIEGPGKLGFLQRYALRLFPALRGARWTHGWNGQVAVTTDHYPHVHEPEPGLIACLGYNGRGVAMASAMGRELARRVAGGPGTEIDMPITGIRPIPFHGFWRVGVEARVAYGRVRDALGI